jgi:hypothetical protein
MELVAFRGFAKALFFCLLASCASSDEKAGNGDLRSELIDKDWKLAEATVTPAISLDGTAVTDWYSTMSPCSRDDLVRFKGDGKLMLNDGATKCNASDPQITIGAWEIDNQSKQVVLHALDGTVTWTVLEHRGDRLKVSLFSANLGDNRSHQLVLTLAVDGPKPPYFIIQPSGAKVPMGDDATFTTEAVGNAADGPIHYQWLRGPTDAIPGATEASYRLPSVSPSDDQSSYQCIVSNDVGATPSDPAVLHVVPKITTIDATAGWMGSAGSLAVPPDGLPVITYATSDGGLGLLKCGNRYCSADNKTSTLDSSGWLGNQSLAIGRDGFPIISYLGSKQLTANSLSTELRVLKCGDAACTSGNTITVVDPSDTGGGDGPAIVVPADGLPVVSYFAYETRGYFLKVVKCGDAACSAGNATVTIAAAMQQFPVAVTLSDGAVPVLAFKGGSSVSAALQVFTCGKADCSAVANLTNLTASATDASLALSSDGTPIISYWENYNLNVSKCGDARCSSNNTTSTVTAAFDYQNAIMVPPDGLPVLAYYGTTSSPGATIVKCGNPDCSSNHKISTLDASGDAAYANIGLAVTAEGQPIVLYHSKGTAGAGSVKVAVCSKPDCSS